MIFVSLVIEIAIICCKGCARRVPLNYILLLTFTVCQSFVFGVITSMYTAESVLMAAGMTLGMTFALTLYACTTKTDFTACGALFFTLSIGMMALMALSFFMTFAEWWYPVLSALLLVFYGLFLIYDTQMVLGGGKHELTYDDYIVGALILYVDIMMIFLELLKIFGSSN